MPLVLRHRSVMHREIDGLALPKRHHLGPALHPRPLLAEDELAAGEIVARLGQEDGHLQGKGKLAVEVLVQAVEVAGDIFEQQRRRPRLAGCVAGSEEGGVSSG